MISYLLPVLIFLLQALPVPQGSLGRVEGTVISSANLQPVPNARVTLSRQSASNLIATTDDRGRFFFQGLNEGSYDLEAHADGYVGAANPIAISAGEVVRDFSIGLTAISNVSGRVRDAVGNPLINVPVQLLRQTYDFSGQRKYASSGVALTNDRGEYRLYWVTPGRYFLLAGSPTTSTSGVRAMFLQSAPGMTANGTPIDPLKGYAFYPGVTDFANAQVLDLKPATEHQVDLIISAQTRTYSIRGRIIDSRTGRPPSRAYVVASTNAPAGDSDEPGGLETAGGSYNSATGTFQIRDLVPGVYRLTAVVQDQSQLGQSGPATQSFQTTMVNVSGSDVDGLVMTVAPAITLRGRLRVEGGLPGADSFRLLVLPVGEDAEARRALQNQAAGFYNGVKVNADGSFVHPNIAPGAYRVELTFGQVRLPLGAGGHIREARFEGTDVLSNPLQLSGLSSGILEIALAAGGGKLEGTVLDERSQPVPNAQVVIVPDRARHRSDLFRKAIADEKGQFRIPTIAPGNYKVFSWDSIEEFEWFSPDLLAQSENRGVSVYVSDTSVTTVQVRIITSEGNR